MGIPASPCLGRSRSPHTRSASSGPGTDPDATAAARAKRTSPAAALRRSRVAAPYTLRGKDFARRLPRPWERRRTRTARELRLLDDVAGWRTPESAQDRARSPRNVPEASLHGDRASCAIFAGRFSRPKLRIAVSPPAWILGRRRPRCVIAALQKRRNSPAGGCVSSRAASRGLLHLPRLQHPTCDDPSCGSCGFSCWQTCQHTCATIASKPRLGVQAGLFLQPPGLARRRNHGGMPIGAAPFPARNPPAHVRPPPSRDWDRIRRGSRESSLPRRQPRCGATPFPPPRQENSCTLPATALSLRGWPHQRPPHRSTLLPRRTGGIIPPSCMRRGEVPWPNCFPKS